MKLVKEDGSTQPAVFHDDLLSRAMKRINNHVEQYLNVPNPQENLRNLCEYIQSRVYILPLQVGSEGEGYLVFDTSNTRGLRPSPSEALKARLATVAREDPRLSRELIAKWNTAAVKLERSGQAIDAMDDYLHAVWCSKEGYTSKRTLDRIATRLSQPERLNDFANELENCCDSYLAVVAPSDKSSLTEDLRDLNFLNVQSHSFLMMIHRFLPASFPNAVNLVLSLQIRNVTVGPQQANAYEKDWPRWAILVREGRARQAFDEIRQCMVPDKEFRLRLENAVVKSPRTARHLLRRLDPISRPGSGVQPIEVHVEHILPKSVVSKLINGRRLTKNVRQWIEDLGESVPNGLDQMEHLGRSIEPALNRLGNQALFNDRANRGARDLPFEAKKNFYKRQALELTNSLCSFDEWGLVQISDRQKKLAKNAHLVWAKDIDL